jgi:hypothetical protein
VANVDDTGSVLINDTNSSFSAWVDVWIESKDVACDWNQYIFYNTDFDDMVKKSVQENADVFDLATSMAINYLEHEGIISQESDGTWINK